MNMTTAENLIPNIIDRLSRFPRAQRAAVLDAYQTDTASS